MNFDLLLAILALDSYNRGYNENVDGLPVSGSLGLATIVDVPLPDGSVEAGFYAIAYNWNGETIISYRGTNFEFDSVADFLGSPLYNDVFGGWTLGAGFSPTSQGQLAIAFYEAVSGVSSIYDTNAGTTIFTGHSLGGGLAGANDNLAPDLAA